MKVTKLIREYVEEQVSKVYDTKINPYSEQAEIDRQKIKDFEHYLRQAQQELIDQFLIELPLFNAYNREPTDRKASVSNLSYDYSQNMINEMDWKRENIRKKKDKIKEIMLALELVANRQELNDMIAKLLEGD